MGRSNPTHRERLIDAMTVTAARYGYREASIARVVAQAGVSRATFYQHFEEKEACFHASYHEVAKRIAAELRKVFDANGKVAGQPREILRRMLEGADREPAAARIVLLEALAAGPAVRAEHEKLLLATEAAMDAYLGETSLDGMQLEIPTRALFGGLGNVVAVRVFRGEAGRLIDLLDDLDTWLRTYLIPAGTGRRDRFGWAAMGERMGPPVEPEPSPLSQRLPRGRTALSPPVVASEQRQRVLAAVASVAMEKGYEAMTVADIVATAGIAREAFYTQFRNKEDAFLSAQAYALETSLSMAAAKFFIGDSWLDRVWDAALPMLRYIASVPDLTTLDFVESYTAGTAAIRRSYEGRMAYTLFLEEGYRQRPEAERLPRLCSEAIAGAVLELMRQRTVEGRIDRIHELAPQAIYVALAPFVGPTAALELIEAKAPSALPGTPSGRSREPRPGG